jgi:hypothetical protein
MAETTKGRARDPNRTTAERPTDCTCEPELTPGGRLIMAALIRTLRWADWPPDVSPRTVGAVWDSNPQVDAHIRDCLIALVNWSEFDAVVEVFDRLRSMDVPVPAPDCPHHGRGRKVH